MGNSVILILADGGDDKECNYGQYLRLQKSGCIAYNNDFEQIVDKSMYHASCALKCECPDSTSVYVIREQATGGQGFDIGSKQERAEKVVELINKQTIQDQIIIIAHKDIEEKLQGTSTKEIMCYRTGGDEGAEWKWKLVCEIVDECLSKKQSLSFEQIKEKINYCTIKKKLRVIIHKLELLIAPLNIECQGKESQHVNINNGMKEKISCMVTGDSTNEEMASFLKENCAGKSLKVLLEERKYLSNDEISDVVKQLNAIPSGSQDISHVKNICKEFYKNLQFISKKVFFEKRQGELP